MLRMKSRVKGAALVVVIIASGLFLNAARLRSGGAVVMHGEHIYCWFQTDAGFYQGPATLVRSASGNVNARCSAHLQRGTAVPKSVSSTQIFSSPWDDLTCKIEETPSGNANVNCKNQ